MVRFLFFITFLLSSGPVFSGEIALSFDDAPMPDSIHFKSIERTQFLIEKLKALEVPGAMIFANPCKRSDVAGIQSQLELYRKAGHFVANHTCNHFRLDEVGADAFISDSEKADLVLSDVMGEAKFFRYPYLNEGADLKNRDAVRAWLVQKNYRHGMVSIDNDDYLFSSKLNQARNSNKKIDMKKLEKKFLDHLLGAVKFYDQLARKNLGRSPKHVILLHEMDATVLFIEPLVKALRKEGWKIISAKEAYQDEIYKSAPKNVYGNNGIIAQLAYEKNEKKEAYDVFYQLKADLNKLLNL